MFDKEAMREKVRNLHASTKIRTGDDVLDSTSNKTDTDVPQIDVTTPGNTQQLDSTGLSVQSSEASSDTASKASIDAEPECLPEIKETQVLSINMVQRLDPATFPNQPHSGSQLPTTSAGILRK